MNHFFSSDLHFDHKNVINFCKRPFDSVEEMNESLITRFNSVVGQYDSLYLLGDISFSTKFDKIAHTLSRLNGIKTLVIGNHDYQWRGEYEDLLKGRVYDKLTFRFNKQKYILDHFPMLSWHGSHSGSVHLHGHTHGTIQDQNKGIRRYDVGVDVNNYYPVSIEEIESWWSKDVKKAEGDRHRKAEFSV